MTWSLCVLVYVHTYIVQYRYITLHYNATPNIFCRDRAKERQDRQDRLDRMDRPDMQDSGRPPHQGTNSILLAAGPSLIPTQSGGVPGVVEPASGPAAEAERERKEEKRRRKEEERRRRNEERMRTQAKPGSIWEQIRTGGAHKKGNV